MKKQKAKQLRFDILTLFPKMHEQYFGVSILKKAQERGLVKITTHDIRKAATDKHNTTDDSPYGGGAGMVMMAEPILKTVEKVRRVSKTPKTKTKLAILSAKGTPFTQKTAVEWSKKYDQIILIVGRYEGIDERVREILSAEEISIGPYVLTDGDVGAMVVVSAVTRLLPGVIRFESLAEESQWIEMLKSEARSQQLKAKSLLEYPHYTRPEVIAWKRKKYRVPKELLSGNHKKIDEWRNKQRKSA